MQTIRIQRINPYLSIIDIQLVITALNGLIEIKIYQPIYFADFQSVINV